MSVQAAQPVAAPHLYRPQATPATVVRWLALVVVSVLLYGGMDHFLFHTAAHRSLVSAAIWAGFYWPLMVGISWGSRSLTIYSDAFIYRANGRTIQADWRDVERIERRWWPNPLWGGDWLVLRRDRRPRPWWRWSYGARWSVVPLSVFDPHWRAGALGYDLRYFAPHLFDPGIPR